MMNRFYVINSGHVFTYLIYTYVPLATAPKH